MFSCFLLPSTFDWSKATLTFVKFPPTTPFSKSHWYTPNHFESWWTRRGVVLMQFYVTQPLLMYLRTGWDKSIIEVNIAINGRHFAVNLKGDWNFPHISVVVVSSFRSSLPLLTLSCCKYLSSSSLAVSLPTYLLVCISPLTRWRDWTEVKAAGRFMCLCLAYHQNESWQ